MSWPTWSAPGAAIPTAMAAAPVQSTLLPAGINSAPSVVPPVGLQYSPEQWAQAQQQNWQQWAQWQQQYQQWHQQYGAEYQKSMSAMQSTIAMQGQAQPPLPSMPNTGVPPPLPAENKPPLPPEDPPTNQPTGMAPYPTMAPKPVQQTGYNTAPPSMVHQQPGPPTLNQTHEPFAAQRSNWQPSQTNVNNKRPYSQPAEYDNAKRPMIDRQNQWGNQKQNQWQQQQQPQNTNFHPQQPPVQAQAKPAPNIEELSEAEKKFDKEFAAWEAQFNKWKDQNANHPDKTQYLEYEKKWESWRNSLLERREQMRRKRLAMVAAAGGNKQSYPQQTAQPPPQIGPDMSRAPPHVTQPQQHLHPQATPQGRPAPIAPQLPKLPVTDDLISKPPPHQNDEPLAFKPPSAAAAPFPTEDIPEGSGDGFLKSSATSGGIPGLDLVKEDEPSDANKESVIDLEKDETAKVDKLDEPPPPKGPDLDAISKGINTILGDQKLLSMLSMVSQNPPSAPPPNVTTDTISSMNPAVVPNFNAPPPPHQFGDGNFNVPPPGNYGFNDQSNHSFEDRPIHGENLQQRESVNNFDDQTRSSFTMGPNDQDPYQSNNFARNQSKFPPTRFGPEPNRNNFGPGPNFASNPPDNRNKFGPGMNRGGDFGPAGPAGPNFNPQEGGNFNQGGNLRRGDFNRGNNMNHGDNFNRPDNYDSFNRGDQKDKFGPNDSFNRPGTNVRGGFDRGNNNFGNNDHRSNFNRSDSFNQRQPFQDKYGSSGNYNQSNFDDYENYEDDDDFEKYHNMFNEDEDNHQSPQKFGQQSRMMDQDHGPRSMNQGRQPGRMGNQAGLLPTPVDHGPGKHNQGPRGFDQGPPPRGMDQRPPLMGKNQGGPPMRGMNQGPPMRDFDQDLPMRDMDQGPPMRGMDRGPQMRGMDKGPSMRGVDQGPPMRGLMDQGGPMRDFDQRGAMRDMNQGPPMRELEQGPPVRRMDPAPLMGDMDQGPPPPLISEPVEPEVPLETEEIFEPVTVIDYEHKSQKTPEPEVAVEPLHMFDYRHKPLNRIPLPQRPPWLSDAVKFIREFDPLLSRANLSYERPPPERYPINKHRSDWQPDAHEDRHRSRGRDYNDRNGRFSDDFDRMERRPYNRDESRFEKPDVEDRSRRLDVEDRGRRLDVDDRGRRVDVDDRGRRPDIEDRGRRTFNEDNDRHSNRRSTERVSRFESPPRKKNDFEEFSDDDMNDFESGEAKKHEERGRLERSKSRSRSPILSNPPNPAQVTITMMEDILNPPGRFNRPPRIVIILRGPPGSGKTYLAKIIKDKEVENGGSAPRIISLDDYFMVEHEKEVMEDGKMVKVKEMVYEYEAEMEDSYRASFIKFFKKTINDGYFPFIIVDNVNDKVKYFGEMWSYAKQNGFQVYICQMDLDPVLCSKRNIHNRNEAEIEECIAGWEPTPAHHPTIDATGLLQSSAISDVEMEEVEPQKEEPAKTEEGPEDEVRSKWDTFDCSSNNLAKLDGVSKPLRTSRTMEEYLQLEDEWQETKPTKPGEKRVRWADLEEQRQQKKMRAIGFVVGHTNWDRMMDPTDGGSALTQTKYFDRNDRFY